MKTLNVLLLTSLLFLCGCAEVGPAVSKTDMGNLEINILAPEGLDARAARIYLDDVFIGNVSSRMPVLQLKRGKRVIKVELEGAESRTEIITILGEPNHQVLNVTLKAASARKVSEARPSTGQRAVTLPIATSQASPASSPAVRTNELPPLYTRAFRVDEATLVQGLRAAGYLGQTNSLAEMAQATHRYLAAMVADFQPPKSLYYSHAGGSLLIRATLVDLDAIERAVVLLSTPPPPGK